MPVFVFTHVRPHHLKNVKVLCKCTEVMISCNLGHSGLILTYPHTQPEENVTTFEFKVNCQGHTYTILLIDICSNTINMEN